MCLNFLTGIKREIIYGLYSNTALVAMSWKWFNKIKRYVKFNLVNSIQISYRLNLINLKRLSDILEGI